MEMIDVLNRLKEIAETKPELVKDAMENVEKTNPKETVAEGGMKDYLHDEAEKLSREEFIKKHGKSMAGFWDSINGSQEAVEGKMPAGLKAYHDKKAGKEDKKETVKEAIQMSADTPEEAGVLMQILKLAGVQQVTPDMVGAEEPAKDHMCGPECNNQECGCKNDHSHDEAPAEENFANEPNEKVQDTDTLVNFHSGGLNRQKKTFPKVAGGDNPMQRTTEDLSLSLREQYKNFKDSYQSEAKKASSTEMKDKDVEKGK